MSEKVAKSPVKKIGKSPVIKSPESVKKNGKSPVIKSSGTESVKKVVQTPVEKTPMVKKTPKKMTKIEKGPEKGSEKGSDKESEKETEKESDAETEKVDRSLERKEESGDDSTAAESKANEDMESASNEKDQPEVHIVFVQESSYLMYFAAISSLLGAVGFGLGIGWTAPSLDCMSFNDSSPHLELPRDEDLITWIGSSMTLTAMIGALMSGLFIEKFGRRYCLIFYGLPFTIGWLTLLIGNGPAFIAGRVILGFVIGALSGTVPGYVVDVSTKNVRGLLGGMFQFMIVTGILMAYVIGAYWHWRTSTAMMMIPTIIMSILMIFMPEGPNWLITKGRLEEAEESLRKLRSIRSDIDTEFDTMVQSSKASVKHEFNLRGYLTKQHLKPLLLSLCLMIFQQASGINVIMFYATTILRESGSSLEPNTGTILIGIGQWIFTMCSAGLIDYFGRKKLLITSGTLHVISLATLGTFYLVRNPESTDFGWIPVFAMVLFIIGFSLGWGPIPWLMVVEMVPHESKSITVSISTCVNWMGAFVVTKTFVKLQFLLDKHGVYYFYAALSLISILFSVFVMPETKNRSYDSIQKMLLGKKVKISVTHPEAKTNTTTSNTTNH